MWRWISESEAAAGVKCSRLPFDSFLAYVGDLRPWLLGNGARGGTRGFCINGPLVFQLVSCHLICVPMILSQVAGSPGLKTFYDLVVGVSTMAAVARSHLGTCHDTPI